MYNSTKKEGVILVDKIQAEKIIASAFDALTHKLQEQKEYNPLELIDDLHQLAKALQADSKAPLHLHSSEKSFELEYKSIAEESLESYAQTQESVERINQEQLEIIQETYKDESSKVQDILKNFSNIHSQVEDRMKTATETIKTLNQQITILENVSNLDPLTRTFNRRALQAYIDSVSKIKNKAFDTRVLLIDIDDFKQVNDKYGHLAGDRVLMYLAKLVSNTLRDGDKVFRFGGEEFLVVINRADAQACEKIAERILQSVRGSSLMYQDNKIKITLSIGSAVFTEGDDFESLIDRADRALYKAKQNGKDQLVVG